MTKPTVLVVFGTRPEGIKMAPVVAALRRETSLDVKTCVTGQHREMLDQVLRLFDIKPDVDLAIMKSGQDLTDITSTILLKLRNVLAQIKPAIILVHGDTSTTFAASLAAFYARIPVAHVEAGLRTHNKYSPFPEEINRKLTAGLTDIHFAPTENAKSNLIAEGILETSIHVTGNTVIDALMETVKRIEASKELDNSLHREFDFLETSKKTILVTGHRRENFGQGIKDICRALIEISQRKDVQIVYPVHPNPNIQKPVEELLSQYPNIHLIPPRDYLPFIHLLKRSYIILTDSGGIQEEAPSLGKPVLVMRDTTERPEAVLAGTVKLVGTSTDLIVKHATQLLDDPVLYESFSRKNNPYGDGQASKRIASVVSNFLK